MEVTNCSRQALLLFSMEMESLSVCHELITVAKAILLTHCLTTHMLKLFRQESGMGILNYKLVCVDVAIVEVCYG